MGDQAKHPVQTTARTFEIIKMLKEVDSAGVTELADRLDMGKSAVHSHLSTLEEYEYVVKSDEEYSLGLRFLQLGGYTRNGMELFKMGKPEADALAEETDELVNIAVEEHDNCVYLYRSRGSRSVNLDIYAGLRELMHATALGKAMMAYMDEERVDEILGDGQLEPATDNSIIDPDELRDRLSHVREKGYAIDDEECLTGLRCVAAPIKGDDGVIGAISVSAPTSRLKGERLTADVPDQVVSAANVIELNIAHS